MSLNLHLQAERSSRKKKPKVFELFQTPTEVSLNARDTNNYYNVYVDYCVTHGLGVGSPHFEDLDKFIESNPLHEWSVW